VLERKGATQGLMTKMRFLEEDKKNSF